MRLIYAIAAAVFVFAAIAHAGEESLSYTGDLPPTKVFTTGWGKDPFEPLVKNVSSPDMKLAAIFYNEQKPSAIINDRIVYKGSLVKGQKVIDIGLTHVILQGESGTIRLELADIQGMRDVVKENQH